MRALLVSSYQLTFICVQYFSVRSCSLPIWFPASKMTPRNWLSHACYKWGIITGEYPDWFSVEREDLGKNLDSGALSAEEVVSPAMQKMIGVKISSDL